MCDYVVSDKPRYNADVSIMEVSDAARSSRKPHMR